MVQEKEVVVEVRPRQTVTSSSVANSDILGSIREAGGAFGKREAAQEDQYFRQMQADQLKNLKKHHKEEIDHHKQEIKRHEEAIKRHNEKMKELK